MPPLLATGHAGGKVDDDGRLPAEDERKGRMVRIDADPVVARLVERLGHIIGGRALGPVTGGLVGGRHAVIPKGRKRWTDGRLPQSFLGKIRRAAHRRGRIDPG